MVALIRSVEPIVHVALDRPILTAVALASVSVVGLWLVLQPSFLKTDTEFVTLAPDYAPQARSLVAGEGFGSFRYPPVYPLMLAGLEWTSTATGLDDGILGAILILAFAILGSVLVFLLGERLWGSHWGLVCVVVWLAYPIFWRLWQQPLSEAPFTILILLAVLLVLGSVKSGLAGQSYSLITGLVLGLGMLVRPSGIGLPILFSLFILTRSREHSFHRRIVSAALVILGAIVVVLPWEIHAWRATGEVIPLSTGGVPTVLDGLTYAVDPSENRPVWVPEGVRQLQWEIYEKSYRELNSIPSIAGYLFEKLRTTPAVVVQLFAIKAARSWFGTDSGIREGWILFLQIPMVTFLLIGMFNGWKSSAQTGDVAALVTMIVLYFWVMTTAVLSIVRYMVPAMALMVILTPGIWAKSRTGNDW